MRKKIALLCAAALLWLSCVTPDAGAVVTVPVKPDDPFTEILLQVILTVEPLGGYDIAKTRSAGFAQSTWDGIDAAVRLNTNSVPEIDLSVARPSFCSSACYLVLLKALSDWDASGEVISNAAWANLKPYVLRDENIAVWPYQDDGMGCWGRANANGPGMAVLAARLGAGENIYIGKTGEYNTLNQYWSAWDDAKTGDFLKIFWNDAIGYDAAKPRQGESGHMVIYLGRVESYNQNTRDDWVYYWSSNGSGTMLNGGYGISRCRASQIHRAVLTRITSPAAFDNAKAIAPDDTDPWLYAIGVNHLGTVAELKAAIAGENRL